MAVTVTVTGPGSWLLHLRSTLKQLLFVTRSYGDRRTLANERSAEAIPFIY